MPIEGTTSNQEINIPAYAKVIAALSDESDYIIGSGEDIPSPIKQQISNVAMNKNQTEPKLEAKRKTTAKEVKTKAPKRRTTAYGQYVKKNKPIMRELNPDLPAKSITLMIKDEYAVLGNAEKAVFNLFNNVRNINLKQTYSMMKRLKRRIDFRVIHYFPSNHQLTMSFNSNRSNTNPARRDAE